MVFVADDLGAWLVAALADAGRRRLTEWALGSDQERALRRAAAHAVEVTAAELCAEDGERAGEIAMVVDQVFNNPIPGPHLAGQETLLETLQAGIAERLAVLDDPTLTGTGRSSADLLGVSADTLAQKLSAHLLQEVIGRGAQGGPLEPLAAQLNHDMTHLQGRQLQYLVGQLTEKLDRTSSGSTHGTSPSLAGQLLSNVTDPFALEVHRSLEINDPRAELPTLPLYVPREHDTQLGQVVQSALNGMSKIAVLVGGSSTGKTRACWEALHLLRDRTPPWRVWHPIDPSRPAAFFRELPFVGPNTVVWLNEAQLYFSTPGERLGERIAAGLRQLLRDPARAPVLVLATLWPSFWDIVTTRPAASSDPHAQARELLVGQDISVPAAFTAAQLKRLAHAGDARLAVAAAESHDGQVTQFLAGVPELLARYRNAPPAARAMIHAAMDARRMDLKPALPRAFLELAAAGYLSDYEWDQLSEDWKEQALAYATTPSKGIPGPLTSIRPRPGRNSGESRDSSLGSNEKQTYRLADYLDQLGRTTRRDQIPPAGYWAAAAASAQPEDLGNLGFAAHARGLYRDSAELLKLAIASGDPYPASDLIDNLHSLHPADLRPASWTAAHVSPYDPRPLAWLLDTLRRLGASEQIATLAERAATHASLDDPRTTAQLLEALRLAGTTKEIITLLQRDPASHANLDDPYAMSSLLKELVAADAQEQAILLAHRALTHVPLEDPGAVATLLEVLRRHRAWTHVAALLRRDPATHVVLSDADAITDLLDVLRKVDATEQVSALLARNPATHVTLDNPGSVGRFLATLLQEEAHTEIRALLRRNPAAHASLNNAWHAATLLSALHRSGASAQVNALATQAAATIPLADTRGVTILLGAMRAACVNEQRTALIDRAASGIPLYSSIDMAVLLDELRKTGQAHKLLNRDPKTLNNPLHISLLLHAQLEEGTTRKQIIALADRATTAPLDNPRTVTGLLHSLHQASAWPQASVLADHAAAAAPLNDPGAVAALLDTLREIGTKGQVTTLLSRNPAAHAELDNSYYASHLLVALQKAGAQDQVSLLIDRLPAEGSFDLWLQEGHEERFGFGRKPNGQPTEPWTWDDIDRCSHTPAPGLG